MGKTMQPKSGRETSSSCKSREESVAKPGAASPLDVQVVPLDVSTEEIVEIVREGRERDPRDTPLLRH
jgi:hypothetical protein